MNINLLLVFCFITILGSGSVNANELKLTGVNNTVVLQLNNARDVEFERSDQNVLATLQITSEVLSDAVVNGVVNPVVTISASPLSVITGGSSTVSWSVINNPVTCDFIGNWPGGGGVGVLPSNFPASSFVLSNITSDLSLSVLCDNAAVGDSGIQSVQITIAPSTWASCSAPFESILGNNEDRTIRANSTALGDLTNGTLLEFYNSAINPNLPLSDIINVPFGLSLTKDQYIAGQFSSGSDNLQARFQFSLPTAIEGPVATHFTAVISECPGDFNIIFTQSTCKIEGVASSLFWSTNPVSDPSIYCMLDKNKTYYLNMVHALEGGNEYQTSSCTSSYCGIIGTPKLVN